MGANKYPPSKQRCPKCGEYTLYLISFQEYEGRNTPQVTEIGCTNCNMVMTGHDSPWNIVNHEPTKPEKGHDYIPDWWPGMRGMVTAIGERGGVQVTYIGGQVRWFKPGTFRESFTHAHDCISCNTEGESNDGQNRRKKDI